MHAGYFNSFTDAFRTLVELTNDRYQFESAPRGMKIRENLFVSFTIENPRDRLLFVPERGSVVGYTMAEILWYMLGSNSTAWISNYASFWEGITDDGITANSAYGARIFKQHEYQQVWDKEGVSILYNQWQYVKDELKNDPDSRRAVIHIRMPQDSVLARKDVPCTLTLQFFIRDGALDLVASMRSSDLILGITHDVPAFTFMQEVMANELGVKLGKYHHVSNSLHVYERHFDMCKQIIHTDNFPKSIPMPALSRDIPLERIDSLQDRARNTTEPGDLVKLCNEARTLSDPLWTDWAHILLAHRAKKLKNAEMEKWFHDGLTIPCFRALLSEAK